MRKKQNIESYLFVFSFLTLLFIVFEFLLIKQNSEILKDRESDPYLVAREFAILFNVSLSYVNGVRGIYRTNVGYLIVYYVLICFIVYRNITQFSDFGVSAIYIIQCVMLGVKILYFTYAAFNVFYVSFWLTFKFLGARKQVINAYIVRLSLKALREAYFLYGILIILYMSCPTIYPGIGKVYKPWKLAFIPGFIITGYNEDDENVYRKIGDIILWFCIFLELLLNRVVKSIVRGANNFSYDTYIAAILFIYTILSTLDLYMYGSGLKEFLANKNKPKDFNLERSKHNMHVK